MGVHPTRGLVPHVDYRRPGLTLTTTVGPMTRNVRDAAITLQVLAGPDGRDVLCREEPPADMESALNEGVVGLRLGWTDDFGFAGAFGMEKSREIIAAVRGKAERLVGLGARLDSVGTCWEPSWDPYVATRGALGEGAPPARDDQPAPEELRAALELRERNRRRLAGVLTRHDALLTVTTQIQPPKVETWDRWWNASSSELPASTFAPVYTSHTQLLNWLGWPAIAVPAGLVDGLPVSLQIIARPGREDVIFRIAAAFEGVSDFLAPLVEPR